MGSSRTYPGYSLTPREQQILALIGEGWSARVIAKRLVITMKTLDFHRERIRVKLGIAPNGAEYNTTALLVREAIRRGLAEAGVSSAPLPELSENSDRAAVRGGIILGLRFMRPGSTGGSDARGERIYQVTNPGDL